LASASGIRSEDEKEGNRCDDDAGDDDEQDWTAEGWSFVGRRDWGGCHECWMQNAECTKVRFLSDASSAISGGFCKRMATESHFLMMCSS